MEETSENLQNVLRQQIQFYLSSANLLTDYNLCKTIKESSNHWLSIKYFLNCTQVRELLKKMNISLKRRKKFVYQILKNSNVLKVRKYRVKRKVQFKPKRYIKKIVYVQSQNENALKQIQKYLNDLVEEHHLQIEMKKGNKWLFILIEKQEQAYQIQRQLRIRGASMGISKILNGEQWANEQRKYQQILTKIKNNRKPKTETETEQQQIQGQMCQN